uniref:Appetite-regulating hormone n=1 Tax=Sphenodon punctatus TaxID=8508 RepID=A0A8D0HLN5_SPHPU
MFLQTSILGVLLICTLCTETTVAGSSFLSPEQSQSLFQRKESKKPTPKLHRRDAGGFSDSYERQTEGDCDEIELKFNVPFEIGVKVTEKQYQEYGQVLEKFLGDMLEKDAKGNSRRWHQHNDCVAISTIR